MAGQQLSQQDLMAAIAALMSQQGGMAKSAPAVQPTMDRNSGAGLEEQARGLQTQQDAMYNSPAAVGGGQYQFPTNDDAQGLRNQQSALDAAPTALNPADDPYAGLGDVGAPMAMGAMPSRQRRM